MDYERFFMRKAFEQAEKAFLENEVPVGAVLVKDEKIIKSSHNIKRFHAEFLLLKDCNRYDDFDLYVTLEPCCLCSSLISHTHIRKLFFGAYDPKTGGVEHNAHVFLHTHHKPEIIGGVLEKDCSSILKKFFKTKRL